MPSRRTLVIVSVLVVAVVVVVGLLLPSLGAARRSVNTGVLPGSLPEPTALSAVAGDFSGGGYGFPSAPPAGPFDREAYDRIDDNPFRRVSESPLSTFSVDVDTASYANTLRFLDNGQEVPKDAVRIEEFINAFGYGYTPPASGADAPLAARLAVAACPWAPDHKLVRVALKGREVAAADRPAANLVFLLDTSGSMNDPDKLPLVKRAVFTLLPSLRSDDRLAVVTYAGSAGVALPSTPGDERAAIEEAVRVLEPAGGTRGSAGIERAYEIARENRIDGGINRVILATDGDFNLGTTDRGSLTRLIEEEAATGVGLTVLGFGTGNYNDAGMEELSNLGDGNYAYVSSAREAERVLGSQVGGTLQTIAKDVKLQVEFNPAAVEAYRLIGYENRVLADADFNDDRKDAGDVGAGHEVTAFYEVVPAGGDVPGAGPPVDELKYQEGATPAGAAPAGELLTVKLRWKQPDAPKEQGTSELAEFTLKDADAAFEDADPAFRFAAAVAGWGMLLRGSEHRGEVDAGWIAETAEAASGEMDPADRDRREGFLAAVRGG